MRISLIQQMQQSHGNRAVQKFLQRSSTANSYPKHDSRIAPITPITPAPFTNLAEYEAENLNLSAPEPTSLPELHQPQIHGNQEIETDRYGRLEQRIALPAEQRVDGLVLVQRCGAEVHEGCACAAHKGASASPADKDNSQLPVQTRRGSDHLQRVPASTSGTRASGATGMPVQRDGKTGAQPAPTGGIQAPSGPPPSAGTIIKLPGATLFNVSKAIDVGKGTEGSVPLYEGLVEVPYIGPVKLDVKGTGKLSPSLTLSASGSLHDAQVQTPSTLAQTGAKMEASYAKEGTTVGGAVGGFVRNVTGSETAGGLAGGAVGAMVGSVGGGAYGAYKGGEAGIRAGAGLPTAPVSSSAPMLGSAKLTAEGQAKGRLDGEVAIEASANPTLLPGKGKIKVGLKGGLGLGATGQATVGAQVGYDPEFKGKGRDKEVPIKFQDGKLTLEKASLDLKASINLDLRAIGFAEARLLLGIGRFHDDRAKAGTAQGAAPASAPGSASAGPSPSPSAGGAGKGGAVCKKVDDKEALPDKAWDDMTSIEKVWRKEWDLLNKEWKLWELAFSVSTSKPGDNMEAQVEQKNIKVIDANEWLNTIKKVGTAVANAPKALGAAKNALGLNTPANDNDCIPDESPGAVEEDVKKAKAALGDRLFWREELQNVLGLGKTAALSRITKWKAQAILHQLASTTFDSETQYSFDSTKAGQREVSPGNRAKYGFTNPAKTSTVGLQILTKGLRSDSPPPIQSGSAEYHQTKARYDSKRGPAHKNFGFDVAVLGHGPEGASTYWNRIGHTQAKADNKAWNNDAANYHGPEHEAESAASGGSSERYRVPSQLIGSHSDWL